jgi:hypothetical protein
MIKQYTRDKHGRLTGLLLAKKSGDKFAIGFSKCKKGDKFDKKFATEIASHRASLLLQHNRDCEIPRSMSHDYNAMLDRASRFFAGCAAVPCKFKE